MCFIIITLVVLQVVISFIVEAFVFKIQAREKSRECHKHHKPLNICGCKEGRCIIIILFDRKPFTLAMNTCVCLMILSISKCTLPILSFQIWQSMILQIAKHKKLMGATNGYLHVHVGLSKDQARTVYVLNKKVILTIVLSSTQIHNIVHVYHCSF